MSLANIIESVRSGKPREIAQLESVEKKTPFMERLSKAALSVYEDKKKQVQQIVKAGEKGREIVKGVGKGVVTSATAGVGSLTADPYNLITKGRPTEPIQIPGIGVAKTAGRKAEEYGSQVAKGDTLGMAAAGTRAFGEGLLDVATAASLAQIAKQGVASFLGQKGSVLHTTKNVSGESLASGYEKAVKAGEVPREMLFEKGNILKESYSKGRISDAAQKLDYLSKGLGDDLIKKLKDTPITMADDGTYPEITSAARELIRDYVIRQASPVGLSAIDGLTEELNAQGHTTLGGIVGAVSGARKGRVRIARKGELLPMKLPTIDMLVSEGKSLKTAINEQEKIARMMYQRKLISRDVYNATVKQKEMYRQGAFGK